ncbi:transglutaminase domain-containing protein [Exiguobacterium sp. ZOR0005]|uniref:transglutaminase domain-containing protein n=1 Tax=Exiguobacterium sp. ZOR0005 TaxID=1339226 RepID=UPI000B2BC338|nr:transglutaminase domain-containing protein [Exiguobacterium sp. ZOR0005]
MEIIMYMLIMGLSGGVGVLLFRTGRATRLVQQALRRELRTIDDELKRAEHNPARQFDLLDPIYRKVVFQVHSNVKMKRAELEQLVSDELNRLIKSRRSAVWSSIAMTGRNVLALIMLGVSAVGGYATYQEAKIIEWPGSRQVVSSSATILDETFELPSQIASPEELGMALAYHMSRFDETFSIRYIGKTKDFEETMDAAWDWLEANHIYVFRLSRGGESQYRDHGGYVDLDMKLTYDMTTEEAHQIAARVERIVQEMPIGLNDFEKVKYVNDFVVLNTAYNLESATSPYTPYSILFNGEGVCEGYALTTLLLLEAAGVETRYISGEVETGLHAWSLVKLDGEWYHLDTTWNDPVPNQPGKVGYDYFLVSDATLRADHTWEEGKYPVTAMANYQ